MIRLDEEAQKIAEKREFDLAMPFDLRAEKNAEPEIVVFPILASFAQEFVCKYRGNYFSDAAVSEIRATVTPLIQTYGYAEDPASRKFYYEYQLHERACLKTAVLREDSQRLTGVPTKNSTTFDVKTLLRDGHWLSGTVADGIVVSVAATHEPVDEDDTVEIGTETAPEFRGKGFSKSNVALLTYELLKAGKRVLYCCSNENLKSQHIAQTVGFTCMARRYYYVGRRK